MEKINQNNQINPDVENLNEQEKKARVEFFLIEEIEQAYNDRNVDVKEALADKPELYERLKRDWTEARMEIYHDTEDLNFLTESAKEEEKKSRFNQVTGLENRAGLYKTLNSHFKEIFSEEVLGDKEKFIQALKEKDFSKAKLKVLSADGSFLSFANEIGGHEKGDVLLKEMATIIKNEGEKAIHLGGDEFAIVYDCDENEVNGSIEKIKDSLSGLEIDYLKQYELNPNIDMGVADLPEAIEIFTDMIEKLRESEDGREALRLFNPVKGLENILTALADKRAFMEKGRVRLPLLINIKKKSQANYVKVIGSFRKGGYSATDKEIEDLGKVEAGKRENAVKDFIVDREKDKLKDIKNDFERLRSELILEKALEKF